MDAKNYFKFSSQEDEDRFCRDIAARIEQKNDEKKRYWNSLRFSQEIALLQEYVNNKHSARSIDELFPNDEFTKICNTVFEFCKTKPYEENHMCAEYKGLRFIAYRTPGFVYDVQKID